MSISGIEAANPNLAIQSDPASRSGAEDKEMFLQLLVAQLRYQDPSNPADSTEFLTQSAQFTTLEKMEAIADQTRDLVAITNSFGAGALVGRNIDYLDSDGLTRSGVVSSVQFSADGPTLKVNGETVLLANVVAITGSDAPSGPADAGEGNGSDADDASGAGTGA